LFSNVLLQDLILKMRVAQLTLLAKNLGLPIDERPFKAHITLMRKAKAEHHLDFTLIHWQTAGFCLFEYYSTSSGVKYRVLNLCVLEDVGAQVGLTSAQSKRHNGLLTIFESGFFSCRIAWYHH
jgi:hypothetical protein